MMLALVNGDRRTAQPWLTGHCPLCATEVIPKCGRVNVWHWAHKARADCDPWAEPDSQWHTDWQQRFPLDQVEIPIGDHRADVRLPSGRVIEFQHSSLSVDEIHEREDHYGDMLWVFDATEAYAEDRLNLRRGDRDDNYRSFRWKYPRRSILQCRKPVLLDIGDGWLFHLKKMYPDAPYGGWGYLIAVEGLFAAEKSTA